MDGNQANSEKGKPSFYDELSAVRPALEQATKDKAWGKLPKKMLTLIDDLEEAKRLAVANGHVCEHIDAIQSLSDYSWAQKHLDRAAQSLASACRLVVHKAKPEDKRPLSQNEIVLPGSQ